MRIVLIAETLQQRAGGTERVLSTMAQYWHHHGHEVMLLTFDRLEGQRFYNFPEEMAWFKINNQSIPPQFRWIPSHFIKRVLTARTLLKKNLPDVMIALGDRMGIFSVVVARSLGIPIAISDRDHPLKRKLAKRWQILKKWVSPFTTRLVVMSKAQSRCYPLPLQKKINIIPNPILVPKITKKIKVGFPKPFILSIGRLHVQKGQDLLIEAFGRLAHRHPQWNLIILGEGRRRNQLQKQIIQLGLENRIQMPGILDDPPRVMAHAAFFVLSSRWEGFPNALMEAMANGLPVISFDCDFGPQDIIRNHIDGVLVEAENISALSQAMESFIKEPKLRIEYGQKAQEILKRFHVEKIMSQWDALIGEMTRPVGFPGSKALL